MKRLMLAAAALLALGGAAACGDGSGGGDSGTTRTQIYLTDAPFPFDSISHVDVYISKVEASPSLDTSQTDTGGWVTVAEPQRTFNLLDFQSGSSVLAGEADIPAGQYRAIRLTINTQQSHVIDNQGHEVPVTWPVNGELALNAYVEHALDVTGPNAHIVIDFDVGRSFLVLQTFPPQLVFAPWIRAVNEAATGSIAGVITGPDVEGHQTPLPDVTVLVMTSGPPDSAGAIVATGRTDAQGHYLVSYLAAGQYGVAPQPPAYFGFHGATATVQVGNGAQTVASFQLVRDSSGSGGGPDTSTVTPGGPVASVHIVVGTPSGGTSLTSCDSIPLRADLFNSAGQALLGRLVSWTSSDGTVLRLEGIFGVYAHARALKAGSSTVVASSEGKADTVKFNVTGADCVGGGGNGGAVETVTFSPSTLNAAVGDSIGTLITLKNAGGATLTGRAVVVTVADSSVASIMFTNGQSVILRARKLGSTTVTASSEGKSGSATVNVH